MRNRIRKSPPPESLHPRFAIVFAFYPQIFRIPTNTNCTLQDLYFTVLGGVLFLSAGIMTYNHFSGRPKLLETETSRNGMMKAWAAIIAGVIYFIDAVFTFRAE